MIYLIAYHIAKHDAGREEALFKALRALPAPPPTQALGFAWLYESSLTAGDIIERIKPALEPKLDQLVVARIGDAVLFGPLRDAAMSDRLLATATAEGAR